ncbi:hypothetical protein [Pseudoalteromonas 'SMAR']|uniref:hypothetical protein n=1 Tax=Pseudoalteromonas 'SMAR' TaxID=3416908 RepID=UPI003AF2C03C
MKTIASLFFAALLLLALSWVSYPLMWLDVGRFDFPWEGNLGWVGFEILTLLFALVAVLVMAALVSVGVIGLLFVVLIGLVMALLLNSLLALLPFIALALVVWLVIDKPARQTT